MVCQACSSGRVANISAKCDDRCSYGIGSVTRHGYAPDDMGVGGGDYLDFDLCLDCGKVQGTFPVPPCSLEG